MDEFAIIARYFSPLVAGEPGAFDLLDDGAVIEPQSGTHLVVTTDTLVAGIHFLPDEVPENIAFKLLRVNLSDLAAMGARPRYFTLNTAFPPGVDEAWLERFSRALAADQNHFGIHLIGGDTVSTPGPMSLTVTAMGQVPAGYELRRAAAKVGDLVYVSGTIGDAMLGLKALRGELPQLDADLAATLIARYRRPQPRVELGIRLTHSDMGEIVHAVTDVSDGLVADLARICKASGVGARLRSARVPLSAAAKTALEADPGLLETILTGGDDYELLMTTPPAAAEQITRLSEEIGLKLTAVGRIAEGEGVRVLDEKDREVSLSVQGYRHF